MQLIIAEKPSLGRAIAQVLPAPHSAKHGYIECGQDIVVTWCTGHLLEPCGPEAYQPQYAKWNIADLPIAPTTWKLSPRSETMSHLRAIGSLLENAHEVIHAGDPDREGQLMVDEVLNYFNVELPVQRLLVNDLTPQAIKVAFSQLKLNADFKSLSLSAQARQRADWLYGINLTRAITLVARNKGREGVFSVGRVQTPVLGLIVKRDNEIEQFEATRYFSIQASFESSNNGTTNSLPIIGHWQTPPSREIHCDEQGRLLNRKIAERVVRSLSPENINSAHTGTPAETIKASDGVIKKVVETQKINRPPLPFSLSTLQIEAAKLYGYSPQFVLDGCQILYEKHKLITYPKSDCRYLPEKYFDQRHNLLNSLIVNAPGLAESIQNSDLSIKSQAWDDQRTGPHHAIIPTEYHGDISALHDRERKLYLLICRNYISQFYPNLITNDLLIEIAIGHETFKATETVAHQHGWNTLFEADKSPLNTPELQPGHSLKEGDKVKCSTVSIVAHKTSPPNHFTDATLLAAMSSIAEFVEDPYIKKTLRASDGLGTEATRAAIIETLYRRDYIIKNGHQILSTKKGQDLLHDLPANCTAPDMTAVWEASLDTISSGSTKPKGFIERITNEIGQLVEEVTGQPIKKQDSSRQTVAQPPICPKCQSDMLEKNGKFGKFWACSQFPNCRASLPWKLNTTQKAKAVKTGDSPPIPCPNCHAPLVRRSGTRGEFWGCSNYPSCRKTFKDIDGKPQIPINPRP